jgi:hypothetical protein
MKVLWPCLIALVVPVVALAEGAPAPEGAWALPGSSCPFTLDLANGHVTRTTGTLTYSTKVTFVPSGEGWLLKEQLEKHNDGLSCKGEKAEVVLTHLKGVAYIEVKGETLYYFHSKGKPLAHSLVRRGT